MHARSSLELIYFNHFCHYIVSSQDERPQGLKTADLHSRPYIQQNLVFSTTTVLRDGCNKTCLSAKLEILIYVKEQLLFYIAGKLGPVFLPCVMPPHVRT